MSGATAFWRTGSWPWRAWRSARKTKLQQRIPRRAPAKQSAEVVTPSSNPLASLASRFSRHTTPPAAKPAGSCAPPVDPLQALAERWQQLPAKISVTALEKDPELTQTQIQLIYDTEIVTQAVCGAPSGDDALLLRIAQAPNQVEQE